MKRSNKLNEAAAIISRAQAALRSIQKLQLSLRDNVALNSRFIDALEALEFLKNDLRNMAMEAKEKKC